MPRSNAPGSKPNRRSLVADSLAKPALALVAATWASGCTSPRQITYTVENIPKSTEAPAGHAPLVISPLHDIRRKVSGNEVLFKSSNETTITNESYCINAEEGYEPHTVGTQISEALAKHLRRRGVLRLVEVGGPMPNAYFLRATLRRFYAAQKSAGVPVGTVGALTGVVGVAVASASIADSTPGMISIEIVDWNLYDQTGRLITKLPDLRYTKRLSLPSNSSCSVVYDNVNEQLKKAFENQSLVIERALAAAVHHEAQVSTASTTHGAQGPSLTAPEFGSQPNLGTTLPHQPPPESPW